MGQDEQLSFLNIFEGRKSPSRPLINKARRVLRLEDQLASSSIRAAVLATNSIELTEYTQTESKFKRAFLLARVMVRTTLEAVVNAPIHIPAQLRVDSFHKQLQAEYGDHSFMPTLERGYDPPYDRILNDIADFSTAIEPSLLKTANSS